MSSQGPGTSQRPLESQAPVLGRAKRWLGSIHFSGVFWYRFHCFGARVVPEWALAPIIAFFTGIFYLALQKIGRAIVSNLEPVLGPCGSWEAQRRRLRTFSTFAWCLTERYERLATERTIDSEHEGGEIWHELLAGDQGILLVTAHIGHWESGALGAPTGGRHVNVVREEELDPDSQAFTQQLFDERLGGDVTMHFAGDPLLGMKMLSALRRGEIVAVQGDRPRTGGRSHRATLFGRPFDLPLGPAALARAAGAPMLPVFIFRQGRGSTRVVFRPPIHIAPEDDQQALGEAMEALAQELETAIRRAPHQWFCFRELWPRGDREPAPQG